MRRRKERRRREAKSRCERWAAATSAHGLNVHSQDSAVLYFPVFSVVWALSAQCKCQSVHSVLSAVKCFRGDAIRMSTVKRSTVIM